MHNVMIGYDDSRYSDVAVQQAVALAERSGARLHLLHAMEPVGPGNAIEIGPSSDPVAYIDRMEKLRSPEEPPLHEDMDGPAEALARCEEAGLVARLQTVRAMAVPALRENCVAMDLLVLGRRGTVGRREIGSTASNVMSRPVVPTLLCRDTVVPWGDVMVAYEPTPNGGRALKTGALLAQELNTALDVVIADPEREKGRRAEAYVSRALRAFQLDGRVERHEAKVAEALQHAALEHPCSVVVAPAGRACPWPWTRSDVVNSALSYPGALALVVP